MTKYDISESVKEGLLSKVSHGYYTFPETITDNEYLLSRRYEGIVFSHYSALFLNGLSERTPLKESITISTKTSISYDIRISCQCFYIKEDLYPVGLTKRRNSFGNIIKCYDAERTICDILRSRSRINDEAFCFALKAYAALQDKDINRLFSYAELFHVSKKLLPYMEVLL